MNHGELIALAWVTYSWVALFLLFLAFCGAFDRWITSQCDVDVFMLFVVFWPLCLSFIGVLLCAWLALDLVALPIRLVHRFGCRHFGWTPVRLRVPFLSRAIMNMISLRNHRNTRRY